MIVLQWQSTRGVGKWTFVGPSRLPIARLAWSQKQARKHAQAWVCICSAFTKMLVELLLKQMHARLNGKHPFPGLPGIHNHETLCLSTQLCRQPQEKGSGVRVVGPCQQPVIWLMLTPPARWLSGSAVIPSLKSTDGGQASCSARQKRFVWIPVVICEWAQTPGRRGDNSGPCRKTTNKPENETTSQEVLPCPSLWDTLQGEETDNGHS